MLKRGKMIGLTAGFALTLGASVASAQTVAALKERVDPLPATREWAEVLQVKGEKSWDAKFTVKMKFAREVNEGHREATNNHQPIPSVSSATLVLPWVAQSATQRGDVLSVRSHAWMGTWELPEPARWMADLPGLEMLRGHRVEAPPGQTFDFMPPAPLGRNVVTAAVNAVDPHLVMQCEIAFRATSRKVELNRDVTSHLGWPASWPPEAKAAFERQPYLDFAFDASTGMAIDLDADAMKACAMEIVKTGGGNDPKRVPPMLLAEGVAAAVLPGLKSTGDAVLYTTWHKEGTSLLMRVIDPSADGVVPTIQNTIAGFSVRDALSIMQSGEANDAERAIVLAAIYRQLGLPARVMIGFEADRDDDERIAKRLGEVDLKAVQPTVESVRQARDEGQRKAIEADREKKKHEIQEASQPLMWPHLPPFYLPRMFGMHKIVPIARRLRVGRPMITMTGPWTTPQITPEDQRNAADEYRRNAGKLKQARFWVEFAVYDPERGLAWVPVDPGSGADDWKFGTVRDSDRIVVVATGFWPSGIERLYRYTTWGNPKRPDLFARDDSKRIRLSSVEVRTLLESADSVGMMPAGLWGMFTAPGMGDACWQELGFEATRATSRAVDRAVTPRTGGEQPRPVHE